MRYYDSMQALIGNTPLVRLGNIAGSEGVNVFAKLELYNPSGSVKDRTGLYMIADAEKKVSFRRAEPSLRQLPEIQDWA